MNNKKIKNDLNHQTIGAIRYIGLKAIQEAKGGHVGMTISAAPITYILFTKFIKINPENGKWINRDRFVLSGGHGSMSLYPIFYFANLLTLDDIKKFKTEDSKTPGHPEYENDIDNFIDASTGPLGQGFAMAVGMAIAQKHISNKLGKYSDLIDNFTYVICGDGDLQEGITYEASAIAGKYELNKLIVLHDSNKYQLDSSVEKVSIENLKQRFESNNWNYLKCSNDPKEIEAAIKKAQLSKSKPTFIEVETIIAEGLKSQSSNKGHHGVISNEDLNEFLKYHDLDFKNWDIDSKIIEHFQKTIIERGNKEVAKWNKKLAKANQNKEFNKLWNILISSKDYQQLFNRIKIKENNLATRVYLKTFLQSIKDFNPFVIATCADLVSSTNVAITNETILENGQSLPIGIREFAMGAIVNGISLYAKGIKAIGGTFLVFSDYIKSAIRLGALMKVPSVYAFTHDSYLVGGDGPTHQPYDQLPMLRAIENLNVYRPADEEELRYFLGVAFNSSTDSSAIILSRQNIKSLNSKMKYSDLEKGIHIVKDCKNPDYIIAASGSEVQLALEVSQYINNIRIISVPCLDLATKMSKKEKNKYFKAKKLFLTIEASADYKWFALHLNSQNNEHIGAYTFGKSMDGEILYSQKGFNKQSILKLLKKYK